MVTVTLSELERNAVLAALDDRVARMGQQLCTLKEQRDTPDTQFAIEATRDAIRDCMRAVLKVAEAEADVEYPIDMTVSAIDAEPWTIGELTAGWGK